MLEGGEEIVMEDSEGEWGYKVKRGRAREGGGGNIEGREKEGREGWYRRKRGDEREGKGEGEGKSRDGVLLCCKLVLFLLLSDVYSCCR